MLLFFFHIFNKVLICATTRMTMKMCFLSAKKSNILWKFKITSCLEEKHLLTYDTRNFNNKVFIDIFYQVKMWLATTGSIYFRKEKTKTGERMLILIKQVLLTLNIKNNSNTIFFGKIWIIFRWFMCLCCLCNSSKMTVRWWAVKICKYPSLGKGVRHQR